MAVSCECKCRGLCPEPPLGDVLWRGFSIQGSCPRPAAYRIDYQRREETERTSYAFCAECTAWRRMHRSRNLVEVASLA